MVVSTIGFFDGVHRGHQYLIQQVCAEAHRRGVPSLLITFDCHPRNVFAPDSTPLLLSSNEDKMKLLRATGVDDIYVLPFDQSMAQMTAREFMGEVLKKQLGVSVLIIGYDHRFGRPQPSISGESEIFKVYEAYGREIGIEVLLAGELEGGHVSSSSIRKILEVGDIGKANGMLGHPYSWTGNVIHGHAVGRQLGFPTANLQAVETQQLLPANGAYAVWVSCDRWKNPLQGMLNIGKRPTIGNGSNTSIEVHLFDFEGDLYDETLTLYFIARLRAERWFESDEALIEQLRKDRQQAIVILDRESLHLNNKK